MEWLTAALTAFSTFFKWLAGRDSAAAQKDKGNADQATAGLQEIDTAQRARDAAAAGIAADPDSVRRPGRDTAARGEDGIS